MTYLTVNYEDIPTEVLKASRHQSIEEIFGRALSPDGTVFYNVLPGVAREIHERCGGSVRWYYAHEGDKESSYADVWIPAPTDSTFAEWARLLKRAVLQYHIKWTAQSGEGLNQVEQRGAFRVEARGWAEAEQRIRLHTNRWNESAPGRDNHNGTLKIIATDPGGKSFSFEPFA
jgi:hypothetical protein